MEARAGRGTGPLTPRRRPGRARGPLLALAACLVVAAAAAAERRTVEVTAEVVGTGRTPEQARHEALQRARDLAVAEVAGVRVAAQQLRLRAEDDGRAHDAFSYLVETSTQGRIVREEVRHATRLEGDVPVYVVTLRADVQLEEGARDPGFTVGIDVLPSSRTLRDGESVTLAITSSRDCYLTVLNLRSDGTIGRLLPSEWQAEHRAVAGRAFHVPPEGRDVELRAELRPGLGRERDHVLVVATLDPLTFDPTAVLDDDLVPSAERDASLTALNRWLVRIPVERRTEALVDLEVVR